MSTQVGKAHLDLTISTTAAKAAVRAAVTTIKTQLQTIAKPVNVSVKVDQTKVTAEVGKVKTAFAGLGTDLKQLIKVDVSALQGLLTSIGKQITDLRALETSLRALGRGSGGSGGGGGAGGGGAGGGSPGIGNAYSQQLKLLQADLKASAINTTQFEAATRALKTSIDNEIRTLRQAGTLTADQKAKLDSLRVSSGQAGAALKQMGDQAARAAAQAAAAAAKAAASTAQAARAAQAAQAESVNRLGRDLAAAQSKYDRGALSLRAYLREMQRIQAAGGTLASSLAAGSKEALNLERVMGGLSKATRGINDQSIVKIRSDLAAARAEFERATTAAGRFSDKRAALQAYEASMRALEQRIKAVGDRSNVSAGQLGQLNRLSAQLASQRNSLEGNSSGLGISGSILAALRQLPQFASIAGGSLGAMAAQAGTLGSALGGMAALLSPVGLAIGAIGIAAVAATAGLVSLAKTGLAEIQKLQQGLNILQANGVTDLRSIQTEINGLQASLGSVGGSFTRAQFTQATADIVKAGVSSKDALTLLASSTRLAAAEQISLNDASSLLLKNLRQYGLEMKDAAKAGDFLAKAGNLAAGTANDLSVGLGIVGGTGKAAKIEMYELLGMLVELDNKGMNAADVGANGLRAAIASLSDITIKGRGILHGLGIATENAAGKARPAGDIMKDLGVKMRGMGIVADKVTGELSGNGEALRTVSSIMDNRAAAAVINLTGDWKDYAAQIRDSKGELVNYSTIMQQGLAPALLGLSNAWKDTGSALAAKFVGPLAALFNDILIPGVKTLGVFIEGLHTTAATGQMFGTAFTGVGQTLSAFGGVVGQVFTGIKAIWDSVLWPILQILGSIFAVILQAATTALTALFNIVSGIFQGVAAAISTLLQNFGLGANGIRDSSATIAQVVQRGAGVAQLALVALGRFSATLPQTFKLMGAGVGTVLTGVVRIFQGFGLAGRAVFQAAGGAASAFASALGRNAQNIGLIIRGMSGVFVALATAVRNALVGQVGKVLGAGIRLFGQFSDGVQSVLSFVAGGFFRHVVQPVQAGANALVPIYNRVTGIVAGAANAIGRVLGPIGNVLKSLGLNIGEALVGASRAAASVAGGIVDSFAGAASSAYAAAEKAAQAKAASAAAATVKGVAGALEGASGALQKFADDNGTGAALDSALGQVASGIKGVATNGAQLQTELNGVKNTLNSGLVEAGQTAKVGLGEVQTGVQLTGDALAYVKTQASSTLTQFNNDLKTLGTTATATAATVQSIKPPAAISPLKNTAASSAGAVPTPVVKAAPLTAADINALDQYKDKLKGLTPAQLASAKADAIRTNNKRQLSAILAEESRRQREATSAGRAAATQSRQTAAEVARDTATRANLVREIRQSIAAFKLQSQAGKVTAASQLAFNQRMEDFRDRVSKLPPALQSGTKALFDQAAALSKAAVLHTAAGRAAQLSGVALITYKEALRGKSAEQLKSIEADARAKNLGPQLAAVLAEQKRRTDAVTKATQLSGAALIKYKEALRGKSAEQLKSLEADARARNLGPQLNALIAEQKRRTDAVTKANTLSGAALITYRQALRGKSAEQLKAMEQDARARKLNTQLTAIVAEQTRRTNAATAASTRATAQLERDTETRGDLVREIRQSITAFDEDVKAKKVSADQLLSFTQRMEDFQAKVNKLPLALRKGTDALFVQGRALAASGQQIISENQILEAREGAIKKLTDTVQKWTRAELLAARARVTANETDPDQVAKLELINAQIAELDEAATQAGQQIAETQADVAKAGTDGVIAEYERRQGEVEGNLAALYKLELEYGDDVEAARNAQADAEAKQQKADLNKKYDDLVKANARDKDQVILLEAARTQGLKAIDDGLTATRLKNLNLRNQAERDAKSALDEALLTVDRETRAVVLRELLDGLERKTTALEAQQQDELDAENLTEAQKLAIRQKFSARLLEQKGREVEASRALDLAEEDARYADALEAARKDGTLDQVRQQLETQHTAKLALINRAADDEIRDYRLDVQREILRGQNAARTEAKTTLEGQVSDNKEAASQMVETTLGSLDEMDGAQRETARTWLTVWLNMYKTLGPAGAKAVEEITAALKKVDEASDTARKKAASLLAPSDAALTFRRALNGKTGKPETADDASARAQDDVRSLAETYQTAVADINAALKQFGGKTLTPDQVATKQGLEATRTLYTGFLTQIETAAGEAGTKAATAFTDAENDERTTKQLALVEAEHDLAVAEGKDDSPAYLAGLNAALAYWRARKLGLTAGTPEYIDALRKIAELEGKVVSAGGNPLVKTLQEAAGLIGKGGKLQATLSAGLDGLAVFFENGGTKGGKKSILLGAQALVSGLADVFKTGDEDIDKVLTTFVSTVTTVLGKLATGDYIGAAIAGAAGLVATLIDIFQGGKASLAKAQKEISDATSNVKFFDLSKYAKVESRGGFWGFLGFKKASIDQEAVDIAQSLGDAIYNSVSTAFLDGIKQGKTSFSSLGFDIRAGLGQQILQGLIDGFLKGAVMQGILQPFLDKYIAAMKSGNAQALADAANGIQQAVGQSSTALQQFYDTVLVPTSQQLGLFGTEGSTGSSPSAASDLGLASAPNTAMAAPAYVLDETAAIIGFTKALNTVAPLFERLNNEGLSVDAQAQVIVQSASSDLRAYATR